MKPWGVDGIAGAGAVGQSLVEGHEVAFRPIEAGAEEGFVLVYGKVRQAAPEAEDRLLGQALLFILLDGVDACRLVRPRVLQFEGDERKAVHLG